MPVMLTRIIGCATLIVLPGIAAAEKIVCSPDGRGNVVCEERSTPGMFDEFLRQGDTYLDDMERIRRLRMQDLQIQQMERQLQRSAPPPKEEVYADTDSTGVDLESVRNLSLKTCVNYCRNTQGCVAVSWVEKTQWCWLKGAVGQPKRKAGVTTVLVGQ